MARHEFYYKFHKELAAKNDSILWNLMADMIKKRIQNPVDPAGSGGSQDAHLQRTYEIIQILNRYKWAFGCMLNQAEVRLIEIALADIRHWISTRCKCRSCVSNY